MLKGFIFDVFNKYTLHLKRDKSVTFDQSKLKFRLCHFKIKQSSSLVHHVE